MGMNRIIVGFSLLLIVSDVSNASIIPNFRKLVGGALKDNTTATQIAPSPNPSIGDKILNPNPSKDADKSIEKKSNDSLAPNNASQPAPKESNSPQIPNNSTSVDLKGSNNTKTVSQTNKEKNHEKPQREEEMKGLNNNTMTPVNPPVVNKTDTRTEKDRVKKGDEETDSQVVSAETCDPLLNRCSDQKALLACVQSFNSGSREVVALVRNDGESPLKVDLAAGPYIGNSMKGLIVRKHQTKKISVILGENTKLVLNAGYGDCVLQVGTPVSAGNFVLNLPSYDKLLTPINGGYFLMLTVLVLGGAWACCMFQKRRRRDGIAYQELEMGMPESNSAVDVESAEGWDEGWDDDWDEEKAVRSPGGHRTGSISANGLISRSPNRDGWEDNWDD